MVAVEGRTRRASWWQAPLFARARAVTQRSFHFSWFYPDGIYSRVYLGETGGYLIPHVDCTYDLILLYLQASMRQQKCYLYIQPTINAAKKHVRL